MVVQKITVTPVDDASSVESTASSDETTLESSAPSDETTSSSTPPDGTTSSSTPSDETTSSSATPDETTSSSATPDETLSKVEPPKPKETELRCTNVPDSENFADRGALEKVIDEFCSEAYEQGTQDKDSGAIMRKYYKGAPDEARISINWPPGSAFKPQQDRCTDRLNEVLDSCDTNDNTHKAGSSLVDDEVTYELASLAKRSSPGKGRATCDIE